jgi:Mn2+/Fe2+ NRAMP family transporter
VKDLLHWLKILGPGVVTGAADDDPSGIATYSIAGATAGYSLLWTALITAPMMAVLMGMCARIGLVTGKGLTASMKGRFPRPLVLGLLVLITAANTLNIAADYAGMGAAAHLITPLPAAAWIVIFGAVLVIVEIYFSYVAFARIVKVLCLSLLAYVVTAFIVRPPWPHVLVASVVPQVRWNGAWIMMLLGVLGTTITPYLFFWQASMYIEETHNGNAVVLRDAHADINSGMVFSNLMTFFIIVTTAATLGVHGISIATAGDAALALRPLAGNNASLLFTLGIVGTGLLAVPVMAGASAYALGDYFGWEDSLADRPRSAPAFYGTIAGGLILGLIMALAGLDPIGMLFYSAVFNGIAVIPLIYFVIRLGTMTQVLGRWVASSSARAIAWIAFWLMLVTAASIPLSLFIRT